MSWTFFIIIAILVFIAYQLLQLNRGKKYELALKVAEKSEGKIREFFPHLYPNASEKMKGEIRDFIAQSVKDNMEFDSLSTDSDGLAYYIYLGRLKVMNDKINAKTDAQAKEQMERVRESISEELRRWDGRLGKMVDAGNISVWEKDFVLWSFLKAIYEQFPQRYFELENYFGSEFRSLQPVKK